MRELSKRGSAHPPAPVDRKPFPIADIRDAIDDAQSRAEHSSARPKGRQTVILNVRMQRDEFNEFVTAAGEDYGARSTLFRTIWRFWQQGVEVRALQIKYNTMRTRALAAERKLADIERAIHG